MNILQAIKTTLLALALFGAGVVHSNPVIDALNALESEWAKIYYQLPDRQKGPAYGKLAEKAVALHKQHPKAAGAIFWEAVIKASYASHQNPVSALGAVYEVKALLDQAIELDPKTMGGSAYVVLGTLYHLAPPWPVAFGDDDEAEKMFKTALAINPNGIDSNFYYAQFLQDKGEKEAALRHFERASTAPIRPEQVFADTQLEEEAKLALKNAGGGVLNGKKELFSNLGQADNKAK